MRTLRAVQISLGRNLVSPAALILVAVRNVLATAIHAPLALAIHRLAATSLGTVLLSIRMWTDITIVLSHLAENTFSRAVAGTWLRTLFPSRRGDMAKNTFPESRGGFRPC